MRKLTFMLAVAAFAVTSAGCTARCRNLFHKGSPCGTLLAPPAMLSAPMAMAAPMSAPIMQPNLCVEQQPMCVPCDPCDPCATQGVTTGYLGGYMPATSGCPCEGGSTGTIMSSGTLVPAPSTVLPNPAP